MNADLPISAHMCIHIAYTCDIYTYTHAYIHTQTNRVQSALHERLLSLYTIARPVCTCIHGATTCIQSHPHAHTATSTHACTAARWYTTCLRSHTDIHDDVHDVCLRPQYATYTAYAQANVREIMLV